MKDYHQQRCNSKETVSVFAMLMGFDKFQHHNPSSRKHKVLSEWYMHNVASICLRPGSLVSRRRSCYTKNVNACAERDLFGVQRSESENVRQFVRSSSSIDASISNSVPVSRFESDHSAFSDVLGYLQKPALGGHLGEFRNGSMNTSLKHKIEIMDTNRFGSSDIDLYRRSSWKEKYEKQWMRNGILSPRHSCSACLQNLSKFSQEKWNTRFKGGMMTSYPGPIYYRSCSCKQFRYIDQLSFSRRRSFERWKTSNGVQERGSTVENGELTSMPGPEIKMLQGTFSTCIKEKRQTIFQKDNQDAINEYPLDDGSDGEIDSVDGVPNFLIRDDAGTLSVSIRDRFLVEAGNSSDLSSRESPGENRFSIDSSKSHQNVDRSLQSLDIQDMERGIELEGLSLQFDAMDFEREETCSEASLMVVSSEDDESEDLSYGRRDHFKRQLGNEESRSFSYLVDVLDEAGYSGMTPFIELDNWDSVENPINPSVFEALEEKYGGKQRQWHKSERQLLFDLINSSIANIFNSVVNHEAPTRSWFRSSWKREEIEDEVWMMMKRQEKEVSEEAYEKWWELEEGKKIIRGEIEVLLFDELVRETVFCFEGHGRY